jgi:CRP/FNR family cyclic AMP-dependent transcriptional regulator
MSKIWLLKRIDVFKLLSPKAMSRLAAVTEDRWFDKGDIIFREHDAGKLIYLLKSGRVKISRFSKDGRELIIGVIEPGEMFGEDAITNTTERPRTAFAEAVEHSLICAVRVEEFADMLKHFPDLSMRLASMMSHRLEDAHRRMEDLVFRNIGERLSGLLLELADRYGEEKEDGIYINHKITHQEMASRIGSTRETVTATLNEFKKKGLLTMEGRRLILKEAKLLRELYEKSAKENG